MARPLRIEYPGAWYHVMNRGRHKEKIFRKKGDYEMFLELLLKTTNLFSIEIHAYALMPNHYHLLIHTPEGNLSRSMRHINGVYTQRINKKYKTDGSLFRGRYKSIIVGGDEYLLELVRYIHRNPYKAKLEEEIGQYEWSSQTFYMKDDVCSGFLKTKYILSKFSKYEKEARRKLKAFVNKKVPKDFSKLMEAKKWPTVLGGDSFKQRMKGLIKGAEIDVKEISGYENFVAVDEERSNADISRLLDREEEAIGNKKSKRCGNKRRAIVYILRKYYGMKINEISRYFGDISYVAISKQYKKAEEEMSAHKGCYADFVDVINNNKLQVKT